MQWEKPAKELMRMIEKEQTKMLEEEILKAFQDDNERRRKNKMQQRKRITKKIVKETYIKIKHIQPIGGDIEKNNFSDENKWVMYQ